VAAVEAAPRGGRTTVSLSHNSVMVCQVPAEMIWPVLRLAVLINMSGKGLCALGKCNCSLIRGCLACMGLKLYKPRLPRYLPDVPANVKVAVVGQLPRVGAAWSGRGGSQQSQREVGLCLGMPK
jgi:hypothetical protein